jgi:hypothetical protein
MSQERFRIKIARRGAASCGLDSPIECGVVNFFLKQGKGWHKKWEGAEAGGLQLPTPRD